MKNSITLFIFILFLAAVDSTIPPNQSSALKEIEVTEADHLHNFYQFNEKLYGGSEPVEEASFKKLHEMGIKTVISVDGAKPKLALAHKYGIRYVHLPIQYSGVTEEQACSIAKAVRDMTGPIYIHCHHGLHRSPAAAALSLVKLGVWDNQTAVNAMETIGTGKNYTGLYQQVGSATSVTQQYLDELNIEFVEIARVSLMVEVMGQMQTTYDRLLLCKENGWRTPPDHPDIVPAHEALQLREQFHEFQRSGPAKDKDPAYKSLSAANETAAQKLETALREWMPESSKEAPPEAIEQAMTLVSRSCSACHAVFRNTPEGAAKQ